MRYETTTTMLVSVPSFEGEVTAFQCYDIKRVLKIGKVKNYYNLTLPIVDMKDVNDKWSEIKNNLTIKNIFENIFNYSDIFGTTYKITNPMQRKFRLIKYPWICYIQEPEELDSREWWKATNLMYRQIAYHRNGFIKLFLAPKNMIPYFEFNLGSIRRLKENICYNLNGFGIKSKLQPAPYSDCTLYGTDKLPSTSSHMCHRDCMSTYVKKYFKHKDSLDIFFDTEINNTESLLDFDIAQNSKIYSEIKSDCSEKCPSHDCDTNFVFSSITYDCHIFQQLGHNTHGPTTYEVPVQKEPSHDMILAPKIYLIELITYLFGALGTWFGISFIALNPYEIHQKIKNKTDNKITSEISNIDSKKEKLKDKLIRRLVKLVEEDENEISELKTCYEELSAKYEMLVTHEIYSSE